MVLRVLLIDQDATDRQLAISLLEQERHELQIQSVVTAEEFAAALASARFDLVITEDHFDGSEGLTVLERIKQRYPDCPVIMFTHNSSPTAAVAAMKAGFEDYVLKAPEQAGQLLQAVRLGVKRSQEQRRVTCLERRLQSLLNRLDLGVFRATLEGRLVEANTAFLHLLGVDSLEAAQQFCLDQIFPYRQPRSRSQLPVEWGVQEWEERLHRADGSQIWVNWSETLESSTESPLIEGLVEDITSRRRIEVEQQESEDRFRVMADTAPVLLWMAGTDKLCYFFNKTWLDFTGRSLAQEQGNGWVEGVHPDDVQRCLDTYVTHFDARQEFAMDYRLRRYDGEYRWIIDRGIPCFAPDGTFTGYIGSAIDITDRKRAEFGLYFLAEAGAVLSSSLDYEVSLSNLAHLSVPRLADWCAIDLLDLQGELQRVAVVHSDPQKVAWAKELQQRYPIDPKAVHGVAQVLRTGQSELYPVITDEQLVQAARDTEHLQILRELGLRSGMVVPLKIQQRVLGAITLVSSESGRLYDDVDRMLAEELARRAALAIDNARLYYEAQRDRAQAETANRLKDEFLATLSHELRTPLNSILGWSQLLQSRSFDEATYSRALETIERNARLQKQLVEDVLNVSQVISGRLRIHPRSIQLGPVIKAALEAVYPAIEAKSIQLQTQLNAVNFVAGDADRLLQVFWNLLSNAIKFTSPGGQVIVRLEQVELAVANPKEKPSSDHPLPPSEVTRTENATWVQITVADSGIGIHPDFLPHVFERFRQADSSTTRAYGGLGLGLSIVRHLVELHGGTVWAESPGIGQGATFIVRLPVLTVAQSTHRLPLTPNVIKSAASNPLAGLCILLVDDEADGREMLTFMLESQGATVLAAASAVEALDILAQAVPDLMISDISMPEMDGYTLLEQVRRRTPEVGGQIPAIALTAYAEKTHQHRAHAVGFQRHLAKPVEPEVLVSTVQALLNRDER